MNTPAPTRYAIAAHGSLGEILQHAREQHSQWSLRSITKVVERFELEGLLALLGATNLSQAREKLQSHDLRDFFPRAWTFRLLLRPSLYPLLEEVLSHTALPLSFDELWMSVCEAREVSPRLLPLLRSHFASKTNTSSFLLTAMALAKEPLWQQLLSTTTPDTWATTDLTPTFHPLTGVPVAPVNPMFPTSS